MRPGDRYYPKTIVQKLGYLIEECGKALAAVGKTQRHGMICGMESGEWVRREQAEIRRMLVELGWRRIAEGENIPYWRAWIERYSGSEP